MEQIVVNGCQLACLQRGRGEHLLLVHGSASDHRTWRAQVEEFGNSFRTTAYSRRFHWPNEQIADGVDYSMRQQIDDLIAVIESLSSAPVRLVGHSYGALLCLHAAIERPKLVRAMVLEEPPAVRLFADVPPRPSELVKLLVARPRTAVALVKFGAGGVAPAVRAFDRGDNEAGLRYIARAVFGRRGFERLSGERLDRSRDNITTVKAEFSGSGFLPLTADDISDLRIPVLLVSGQQSMPLFQHISDSLEGLLPEVDRLDLPDTCHLMHEQAADSFNQAVLSFLADQPAA